ncbi:unnamed protein product [Durusdinium trenchii]|uniref:EF-hand domain-containing protein n=1 Tax=Durusdinium trenchii TaxID=1381693 RepID=A0ABP0SQA8_9DINO
MDLNADGRLSYFEFMRGCKQMSVANPRRVWRALGRTGLLTLRCVDPRLGEQLGTLATAIWCLPPNSPTVGRSCFNKRSKLRISSEDFSEACQELRYQGDPVACFGELCSEKASNGMSRKEFGFLHSWMSPKGHPDRGFLDAPISKWAVPAEPWTPPPIVQKRDERREKFLDCLLRSYGNIVRAWREGLDRNHDDRMDYQEFSVAIKDVGYAGNAKELWEERSTPQRCMGGWELDGETARLLREFVDSAKSSYGSFMAFWNEALDIRHDDRVLYPEFRDGCLMLGWNPRDVGRLFELLDTDRARYLSWATTSWLSGAELVDGDSGSPRIARPRSPEAEEAEAEGAKVKFTKVVEEAQAQIHDQIASLQYALAWLREHRHRVKCYEGRARNEIPGSHPSAGTTIYSSAPFIT